MRSLGPPSLAGRTFPCAVCAKSLLNGLDTDEETARLMQPSMTNTSITPEPLDLALEAAGKGDARLAVGLKNSQRRADEVS